MTITTRPWDGTTIGDAGPYSSANWRELYTDFFRSGGSAPNLNIGIFPRNSSFIVSQETIAAMSVTVNVGDAIVNGLWVNNDTITSMAIAANSSGNPRIDRVVLRVTYASQIAALAVLQGTPAATPTAPTLTQNTTTWELPLAQIAVANGALSIVTANITDEREFTAPANNVTIQSAVQSGGAGVFVTRGDVFTLNSSTSVNYSGAKSAANEAHYLGGVNTSQTQSGAVNITTHGVGFATINAAVNRGQGLIPTSTPGTLGVAASTSTAPVVAIALETLSVAGLCMVVWIPWALSYGRYASDLDSALRTGTNTSPAAVTGWTASLVPRGGAVLCMAWGECRNETGGGQTFLQLYNNTTGTQLTNTWVNMWINTTWTFFYMFATQTNATVGATNDFILRASTSAAATWAVRQGHLLAMELAF